jgi:hypothetical protein
MRVAEDVRRLLTPLGQAFVRFVTVEALEQSGEPER